MILTRQFLEELGVQLDDASYEMLADHFETTLHERVINEVIKELSSEQAEQLASLQARDGDAVYTWVRQNVPDIADIIQDEIDILLGEVAQDSEKLS